MLFLPRADGETVLKSSARMMNFVSDASGKQKEPSGKLGGHSIR